MSDSENLDFDQVLKGEIAEIVERRIAVGKLDDPFALGADKEKRHELEQSVQEELVGVALSGGGVRAGAAGLGLLQAFHENRLMEDVDYLSTVSGGSYAGAFLSSDAVSNERSISQHSGACESEAFNDGERKTSKRMLRFVFGGEYLRDTMGFFNRQLFGMVLVASVVFSALTAVAALLAFAGRCLDYQFTRAVSRSLGFESEISLALLPALFFFIVWILMWGWTYLRRDSDRPNNVARYSFYVLIVAFLVGIASILGTGSLWDGRENSSEHFFDFRQVWGYLTAAIAASLLPYFSPKLLLKSGTQPRNTSERFYFWVATHGLLYGIPFLLVGYLLQENISGVNDWRSGKIVASSEIKGWGSGVTYNQLWIDILDNKYLYKVESWETQNVNRTNKVYPDNLKNSFDEANRVLLGSSEKKAARPDTLRSLFEKLQELNASYELQRETPLTTVYWSLPLWPDDESTFRERLTTRMEYMAVKNVLADWLGNQMANPEFTFGLKAWRRSGLVDESDDEKIEPDDKEGQLDDKERQTISESEEPNDIRLAVLRSRLKKFSEDGESRKDGGTSEERSPGASAVATANSSGAGTVKEEKLSKDDLAKQKLLSGRARIIEDLNREVLINLYPECVQPQSTVKSFVCLENDQMFRLQVFLWSAGIFLVLSLVVNLNKTSCHSFYRNRLADMWIEKGVGLDWIPMPQVETTKRGYPYHLILGSLAYMGSFDREKSQENIDHFLFSRLHCGSERTGFVDTSKYMNGSLTLQDAIAISGAAISVVHIKNSLIMFLLFITNLRLGQWLENPRFSHKWKKSSWCDFLRYFLVTPMGMLLNLYKLADDRPSVFVADGGHFENLAVDELFRRKCRLIFALDAGADPDFKMEDLTRLVRWSRMKHGILLKPINTSVESDQVLTDAEFVAQLGCNFRENKNKSPWSKTNYLLWKIEYPPTIDQQGNRVVPAPGVMVYLKNTMTGKEPLELVKYQADNKDFPNDKTTNQFFDPDKFESYRQLGYFLGTSAIRDIRDHMLNREVEMDSEVRSSLTLASCLVSHHDSQFAPSSLLETYFEQLRETKGRNRQRILVSQLQNLDLDHSSAITLFEFCNDENEEIREIASTLLVDIKESPGAVEFSNTSLLVQLLDDDNDYAKLEDLVPAKMSDRKEKLRREILDYLIDSYNRKCFSGEMIEKIRDVIEKNRELLKDDDQLKIFDIHIGN